MEPKNNKIKVFTAFILILTFASFASAQTPIVVCPSGCNYTSIQSAINGANIGDTIEVHSGTYFENVVIDKQLILRGIDTGGGKPIVDAGGSGSAITISADGVTLEGLEARYSGNYWLDSGIKVTSNNNVLKNNNISNNLGNGICLWYSNNNTLYNNTANSNNFDGIIIEYSNNNTLYNNNASNNCIRGIPIRYSNNNTLYNNTANSNYLYGIYINWYSNNILTNNTANSNNYDGIYLEYSNNNTLFNNIANSNNRYGIHLWNSSNNKIYLNNFINNTDNVYSSNSNNIWNLPEKITYTYNGNQYTNYLGNYWSDYIGTDSNIDGIGDTPYNIDLDKDNYPLMEPFENYITTKKTWLILSTDKNNYFLGENVVLSIEVNYTGNPIFVQFELELQEPYDAMPDTLIKTDFVPLTTGFYKKVNLTFTIPESPFILEGDYTFKIYAIDGFGEIRATDQTNFYINDSMSSSFTNSLI